MVMERNPETGDILNRNVLLKIFISGIVMAIGTIGVFIYELNTTSNTKAMTVAFTLFVVYQLQPNILFCLEFDLLDMGL